MMLEFTKLPSLALLALVGCGVEYSTLQFGESEAVEVECPDATRCCERELHVHLAADPQELQDLFSEHLPSEVAPHFDPSGSTAVVSYTTWCPTQNNRLRIDGVRGWGSRLSLDAFLRIRPNPIDRPGRPYAVIEVEGGWKRASGGLESAEGEDTG